MRALTFSYLGRAICTPQKYISTLLVYSQNTLEYKLYTARIHWLPMVRSVLRPMDFVSTHKSTDRILMTTINDYLMDNYRPTKDYFSTLKYIQLFSTSSHCCAQLDSFWLRAMDSPWESNCTQHDSTDRYAIGMTEVIRPVYTVVFRVGQWCTQRQLTTGKANGHNVVHMRVLTAILKYSCSVHVAHNGYCYSDVKEIPQCKYSVVY